MMEQTLDSPQKYTPISITQVIPVPAGAKKMTLSARVRGDWKERVPDSSDPNWGAVITVFSLDDKGKGCDIGPILASAKEKGWKTLSKTHTVKENAKDVLIRFGPNWATGTFDFSDIWLVFH